MKIGFIGAGKVGTAFGMYLQDNNIPIVGYYSRRVDSAVKAARMTNSFVFETLEELVKVVDMLFITTPDDTIEIVCNEIAEKKLFHKEQYIIHMSGAATSKILSSAEKIGCFTFSLHPLQAFADIDKAFQDLKHTYFSIEGNAEKLYVIEELMKKIGNPYFKVKTEDKALYHGAACILSNYLVTLMDEGLSYLKAIGISEEDGLQAMMPLILGALNNIQTFGTQQALTGPIARGDAGTIAGHLCHIQQTFPEKESFYKLLGLRTLELAKSEKLKDTIKVENVMKLLSEV
ncbi:MAG: Rossmann-like and DUF2520 domain-containing protein [Bacillota bacterium]